MSTLIAKTSSIHWKMDPTHGRRGEKIINWLRQLMDLTAKKDEEYNSNFAINLTLMLMGKFKHPEYFEVQSLEYIASKVKFFPVYKELCDLLMEWIEIERSRRQQSSIDQNYKDHQSYNELSKAARTFVDIYFKYKFQKWKDADEKVEPSLAQQIHREDVHKDVIKKSCFEAYKYLFPEEVKKQAEDKDYKQSWQGLAIDHVYQKIQEIEKNGSRVLKKATARLLRRAVVNYAPDSLQLVDQQYPNLNKNTEEVA